MSTKSTNTTSPSNTSWGIRSPFLSSLLDTRSPATPIDDTGIHPPPHATNPNGSSGSMEDDVGTNEESGHVSGKGNHLQSLLLWRRPFLSAMWLITCNLIYYLIHIGGYSVMTVCAVLALWQMIANRIVKHVIQLLQNWKALENVAVIDKSIDAHLFVLCTSTISSKSVSEFADLSFDVASLFQRLWIEVVCNANILKVLILVRITSFFIVFEPADFETTLWIMTWILFTVPVALDSAETDKVLAVIRQVIQSFTGAGVAKIDVGFDMFKKYEAQAKEDYIGTGSMASLCKLKTYTFLASATKYCSQAVFDHTPSQIVPSPVNAAGRGSDDSAPRIISWKNRERPSSRTFDQ